MSEYFIIGPPRNKTYTVDELQRLVKSGQLRAYGPYPYATLVEYRAAGRLSDDTILYEENGQSTQTVAEVFRRAGATYPDTGHPPAAAGDAPDSGTFTAWKFTDFLYKIKELKTAILFLLLIACGSFILYYRYTTSSKYIFMQAQPAVVMINTYDFSGNPLQVGNGYYIDPNTIVTDNQVIENAARIELFDSSGKSVAEEGLLGQDQQGGVAYLKGAANKNYLPIRDLGAATIGDKVFVIGRLHGADFSITSGSIGAMRRSAAGKYTALLQLAPPIATTNSGSPVINTQGEATGIVTTTSAGIFPESASATFAATVKPCSEPANALGSYRFPLTEERFEPYFSSRSTVEGRDYANDSASYLVTETSRLVNAGAINAFAGNSFNVWIKTRLSTTVNGSPSYSAGRSAAEEVVNYAVDCATGTITPTRSCGNGSSSVDEPNYFCGKVTSPYAFSAEEAEKLCEYLQAYR